MYMIQQTPSETSKKNTTLKKRIAILFFSFLFLTVGMTASLAYTKSKHIINRKVVQYNTDLLKEISETIAMKLNEVDQMTTAIFTDRIIQSNVPRLSQNEYESILIENTIEKALINASATNQSVIGVAVVYGDGCEIKTSTAVGTFVLGNRAKTLVDQGKGALVWIHDTDDLPGIIGARVLYHLKTQKPIGYLVVKFRASVLEKILQDKSYFENGVIAVVDDDYQEIIGSLELTDQKRKAAFQAFTENHESKQFGSRDFFAFSEIGNTNWKLISIMPSVEYETEIMQLRNWMIYTVPPCAMVIFLVTYTIAASMLHPITELADNMKKVGSGNFHIQWKYPCTNEIGDIQDGFECMITQIQQLMDNSIEQQRLYHIAEMNMLRMQINPHFIYNAMDSISWMARSNGAEDVANVLNALGNFMRSAISGKELIPLVDEINIVKNYLLIQKFRYGDRLNFSVDVPDELMLRMVPRLLLQPLVENSIIHGIEQKIGIGDISLTGFSNDDTMHLVVKDNGIGMSEEQIAAIFRDEQGKSIGMHNVHRRIQLHFGNAYGLRINSRIGVGTTVELVLPSNCQGPN